MSTSPDDPQASPVGQRPIKGRGTAWDLAHRFAADRREAFDDGWGYLDQIATAEQLAPGTHVIEERVRTILASNDSPDIGFDLSINPYRGCEHVIFYEHVCD